VCVVSEGFVKRYAEGRDPLGMQVSVQSMSMPGPTPVVRTIVGVVPEVSETPGRREQMAAIYVPVKQNPWFSASLVVRAAGARASLTAGMKGAISRVDKGQPLTRVRTMAEVAADSVAVPRFRAQLVSLFAGTALVLAGIGIFGVMAFSVHQRTREFGIRMALGAQRWQVLRLVLGDGLAVAVGGIAIGLAAAALLSQSLGALLYGVDPLDPTTFLLTPAVLAVTALIACAVPALRASRVDSAVALRQD
jgi:putative ABC transport system permease protein